MQITSSIIITNKNSLVLNINIKLLEKYLSKATKLFSWTIPETLPEISSSPIKFGQKYFYQDPLCSTRINSRGFNQLYQRSALRPHSCLD